MIVKCSHCGQMFSEKDFDSHTCDRPIKECKFIEVSEIIDGSYGNKKLMNGRGTDGILYVFEVVPRKAIPYMTPLSDDGYHEHQNRRRVNGTEKSYSLNIKTLLNMIK